MMAPTSAELDAMQARSAYDEWRIACAHLGVNDTQCADYERSARAFAATLTSPNSETVAKARRVALEALARGEPMPQDAETALNAGFAQYLKRVMGA
jgi:hypothetical protein